MPKLVKHHRRSPRVDPHCHYRRPRDLPSGLVACKRRGQRRPMLNQRTYIVKATQVAPARRNANCQVNASFHHIRVLASQRMSRYLQPPASRVRSANAIYAHPPHRRYRRLRRRDAPTQCTHHTAHHNPPQPKLTRPDAQIVPSMFICRMSEAYVVTSKVSRMIFRHDRRLHTLLSLPKQSSQVR